MTTSDISYTYANLPAVLQKMAEIEIQSAAPQTICAQSMLGESESKLDSGDPAFFDQINLDEALQIYSLVRTLRPKDTLEIGFCCGASGLAILGALEDNGVGTHHAIDPYQTSYAADMGKKNVARAGLGHRLRFFEAFPENVCARLPRVQFAFIDASHLFDLTMLDFVLVDKLLDQGSVLALHDAWMPAIQKVIRFILSNRGYIALPPASAKSAARPSFRSNSMRVIRDVIREFAKKLPRSEHIFNPEFLKPWYSYGFMGNIAFLKKVADDQRDCWRDFHAF
jgi:predicted O-methyltransferase YrrM